MGLGQFRGSSWVDRRTSKLPQFRSLALRTAGLKSRDFDRRWGVIKNHGESVRGQAKPLRLTPRGNPGLEKRETSGTPTLPLSAFKDSWRFTPGDIGRPTRVSGKAQEDVKA
jgi:hypothetical protein